MPLVAPVVPSGRMTQDVQRSLSATATLRLRPWLAQDLPLWFARLVARTADTPNLTNEGGASDAFKARYQQLEPEVDRLGHFQLGQPKACRPR